MRRKNSEVVHINGKWLSHRLTGTQRYAAEVLRAWPVSQPQSHTGRAILHVPAGVDTPSWLSEKFAVKQSRLRGVLFEQLALPARTFGQVLVNLAGPAPLLKRRQVVVMHDATPMRFPKTFRHTFVAWYWIMYLWLAHNGSRIATVSTFSRNELADVLKVQQSSITVAYNGHEHFASMPAESPNEADAGWLSSGPYLLCVGTLARHKNLMAVLPSLATAGHRIAVVGARGSQSVFSRQLSDADDSAGDRIRFLGRLTDEQLAWVYDNAAALVFPSLYEGFGIPIVEAQARGCPVICLGGSAVGEIAGPAAAYFRPEDEDDLIRIVELLGRDEKERRRLVEAGRRNVARFSWARSASILGDLVTSISNGRRSPSAPE